jgi:hypothetical protein
LRHPRIGEQIGSRKRPLVPDQLLAHVVLHVGHRMRKHAAVQGVCLLAADVLPDLREQAANGLTLASVVQLYPLADTSDRWVWLDQRRLLHPAHPATVTRILAARMPQIEGTRQRITSSKIRHTRTLTRP